MGRNVPTPPARPAPFEVDDPTAPEAKRSDIQPARQHWRRRETKAIGYSGSGGDALGPCLKEEFTRCSFPWAERFHLAGTGVDACVDISAVGSCYCSVR